MRKKQALALLHEFLPLVVKEAKQAVLIGPPSSDHKCSDCPGCECCYILCQDCEWYNWGLAFLARVDKGEFDELI